ncbi:hypothetical protein ACWFRF_20785 [Nocardia sp. NPDC055165]
MHGGETVNVATVELPITYAVTPGHVEPVPDYNVFAEAGKAIAQSLSDAVVDHA